MVQDVHAYCEFCTTCQRNKASNQQPYGLLNSLSAIGIDFVEPLPIYKNRDAEYDLVKMVIDLLTGMVHLYTAGEEDKLHGLPKAIISDRTPARRSMTHLFIIRFIHCGNKILGRPLPEGDGACNTTLNVPSL
ncbi:hypothetical protein BDR03DRAFT_931087 [Suillus americanus]|nr:hypothetical protein BDR03DRAFT_931087 [Suillus americanus]